MSSASSLIATWRENINYSNPSTNETVNKIIIEVNGYTLTATLADNTSATALVELLEKGSITINAHDYGGFEKVGALPESLPENNTQITTSAGDIILYQGSSICFYYAQNTWNFTLLGRVDNAESYDLENIYGSGSADFVLRLAETGTGVVSLLSSDQTVVKTERFSLNGALARDEGVVIERLTYADGTVRTRKVIR